MIYAVGQATNFPQKSAGDSGDQRHKTEYVYNAKDRLTQVKHNTTANTSGDVTYTFGYDALTRPATVQVGSTTLSTTTYNADGTVQQVNTVGRRISTRYSIPTTSSETIGDGSI